ncbi:ankyrin repeat-containing domain protein [Aspergillus cavernicola]|uniref:Ankyrin repeat-containing domain protein n=1 Tax=Aspergillus cavernicola TaxID=176166 RepID=A0ABR4I9P5_9EURO
MALFIKLPSELLLFIATFLEYSWDISSLAGVNHYFHTVLNPYLHQHKQQYSRVSTILWAAQHGSAPTIRKLLGYIQDKSLWDTAVRLAAKHGHTQVVQLFLDARPGSDPREETSTQSLSDGLCYLLWQAATEGHETLVRSLLECGASPTKNATGPGVPKSRWLAQSPLSAAVINGHLAVVKAILSSTGTARTQISDLLFPAAEKQHPDIVRYLLKEGADPNARNSHGFHITYHAAWKCPEPGVRALLENGADPNPAMPPGVMSPLRQSLLFGRMPIANMLLASILENGESDAPCTQPAAPEFLCAAAACGREDLVQKLLQNGSDPNATVKDMRTEFVFKSQCTPLTWATEFEHENIVSLLLDHGAKATPQSLIMALLNQSVPITKLLLHKGGLDPNAC